MGLFLGTVDEAQSAYFYFSETGGGRIGRANLDGTGKVILLSGLPAPVGPALDLARGQMYWGEIGSGTMRRGNLDGTAETIVINPNGGSPTLDLAGGRMYWSVSGGGTVRRANLDGSGQQILITGLSDPHAVALDLVGGKMYWANYGSGDVRRANLDGTGQQTLVAGLPNASLVALDVAGGKMYWTVQQANGDIRRANLDGSSQEILVRNQNAPSGIALDINNGHIYWANFGGGDIRRANLDGTGEQILLSGLSGLAVITLDLVSDGPPVIQFSPQNQSALAGGNVTFAVGAAGSKPLFYRWQFNGVPLPDGTNATLTLSNLTFNDAGSYSAVVSNSLGVLVSQTATLSVPPLFITAQTQKTNVWLGSNVVFQLAITSTVPVNSQWRFNDTDIPGATNLTLGITNVQLADEGEYTAALANSFGSVVSQPAALRILIKPVIVQGPITQSVVVGGNVTFSVEITGNPAPFLYQWRQGSTTLTNVVLSDKIAFLTLNNVRANQAGQYRVAITNAASVSITGVSTTWNLIVLADTDGDGLPDDWENAHGLNINVAADAVLDADGDGHSNWQEYVAGTDPINALSTLRIDSVALINVATDIALRFQALSNRTYTVQAREALDTGSWRRLADVVAAPTNRVLEIVESAASSTNKRGFYRVVTPRSP